MPRTFFGLLFRRVPRTTPPTRPAAAVATPATIAVFDVPPEPLLAPELALRALDAALRSFEPPLRSFEPPPRAFELPLRALVLRPRELEPLRDPLPLREFPPLDDRDEELRPRDDAADERLLDELLFALLLPELPLPLPEPFELLLEDFRCEPERELLLWAIAPP
jgi:hypothetical protein